MSLKNYFSDLIQKVETTDVVSNAGKDENGFYKPVRTVVLRHLQLLRDLHDKPRAREMLRASWAAVARELPPEWLVLNDEDRADLKRILDAKP